jgi:hypothetical protein
LISNTLKQLLLFVGLLLVATAAFSIPLLARDNLNLVGINTSVQDNLGRTIWLATFAGSLAVSGATGWFGFPTRAGMYAFAALVALFLGVVIIFHVSDFVGIFLALFGSVVGVFAGVGGLRYAWLTSKSVVQKGTWILVAVVSGVSQFLLTWALAFFE